MARVQTKPASLVCGRESGLALPCARALAFCVAILFLVGCSVPPDPLRPEEAPLDPALLLLGAASLQSGCPGYAWEGVPAHLAPPVVPASNCMTAAKVDLGRHLFYDRRLSGDRSMSCASCHRQSLAFSDGLARPQGTLGETHTRNSQQLSNVGYHGKLTWANSLLSNLELQAAVPITAETGPGSITELGFKDAHLERFQNDALYAAKFSEAFGVGSSGINLDRIERALAAFQRTLISFDSSYDRFVEGRGSLSASAVRGALVFNSETAECFHCHGGFNFADASFHAASPVETVLYHNNGLYSADDYAGFGVGQRGLQDVTHSNSDQGRFRAPSLRNIGYSFPYMHDGSVTCDAAFSADRSACARNALGKVIDHYQSGGKLGSDGKVHPVVDRTLIRPFSLSAQQQTDLVEFLMSLDDATFVANPAHSNPRPGDSNFGP